MSDNNSRLAIALAAIGVVAAVISASTDLFGLLKDDPAPSANPGATPTGQPGGSAPPPSSAGPKKVAWEGSLTLDSSGLDLDTTPPTRAPQSSAWDFYYGTPQLITFKASSKNLARWTGKQPPTAEDCGRLLATASVHKAAIAQGHVYCARSELKRLALLTITGPKGDGQGADVVLWES
ncbi:MULTISPECIES: hypothetical protein [unclassified Crossiella]|uniref:hypothetical protein n=1 Tax=unclassified Crossiella TaxID=2620835 RepID=UPI001FFEF7E7|nr:MULTISPECIES: hypothetical protein [unclassified Crossiella]MCK2239604.1 hypothetical protein [Crossiella sp. S99.2]MCK2252299.1 hypothetical protein [Crossiella sp. S99.1]